jgi:hypothetical protein
MCCSFLNVKNRCTGVRGYLLERIFAETPTYFYVKIILTATQMIQQSCTVLLAISSILEDQVFWNMTLCRWAVPLFRGLSSRRPAFNTRWLHVGFVVGIVAIGPIFLLVHRFSHVGIIPAMLPVRSSVSEAIKSHWLTVSINSVCRSDCWCISVDYK